MSLAFEQAACMPLTDHLRDLRKRLVRCLLAIALVFCGLFPFAQTLYTQI
ncbi:twin-arginine translocase subunit TatC, partial [Pseudomonas sp. GD04091]|nr:twin-arginine translocase subunit TatC [Pseudomonas sp. GD04091]